MAELHTGFPERFGQRRKLWALNRDGSHRELQLEDFWLHKGGVVLKFAGVDSISEAGQLSGLELQVPLEQRAELEDNSSYVSDLVGCSVWITRATERTLLGTVAEVRFGAGEAPLLVVRRTGKAAGQEFLVPYAEEFVKSADIGERCLEMQLPDGLLELNAPLTVEEKQRQQAEAREARSAGEAGRRRK